ncbi:hypothetical protein BGZ94_000872 [Podila epigama]|nr:hypothetical protein BGZ94_000872 [Podila epigama]
MIASLAEITAANCGQAQFESLEKARTLLQQCSESPTERRISGQDVDIRGTLRELLFIADYLIDYAREMLHAYPYRQVPAWWRELYTDAGLHKALGLGILATIPKSQDLSQDETNTLLREAIRTCDHVLVMTGAAGAGRKEFANKLIEKLEHAISSTVDTEDTTAMSAIHKKRRIDSVQQENRYTLNIQIPAVDIPPIKYPIPRIHLPTMDAFQTHVNGPTGGTPIIITGAIEHWPARDRWTDLDTLCERAGPDRLVPVEIGRQYTDEEWTQKMITMREFIQEYIVQQTPLAPGMDGSTDENTSGTNSESSKRVGYLAQHDLFEQIPRLRRDIDIPDYCMIEPGEQAGYNPPDDVLTNAWFGPGGTVSPMHTDPYHNLLAQVVGQKYVRLYAPSEGPNLYSYGGHAKTTRLSSDDDDKDHDDDKDDDDGREAEAIMLGNTSQVDVENPDLGRYPRFAQAQYVETVLNPGELLYIPFEWWHYIRSLSTSFSVSFWF